MHNEMHYAPRNRIVCAKTAGAAVKNMFSFNARLLPAWKMLTTYHKHKETASIKRQSSPEMFKITFESQREIVRKKAKINKETNIYIPGLRAASRGTSRAGIKQEILRRRFQRQGTGACRDRVGLNKSYPAVMFITWIITKIKCFIWERDSSDPFLAACLNHIHNPCQHHPTLQSWWHFGCCLNFVSSCAWLQFSFCRHHFLPCFIQPSLAASFHESLIVRESPEGRIS